MVMASLSLLNAKTTTSVKDADDRRKENREKAMLLFSFQLLLDKGYVDTASSLASECSLNLELYTICENIDLNSIFLEFEAYYNLRFQRYPQYFRKCTSPSGSSENLLAKLRGFAKRGGGKGTRGASLQSGNVGQDNGCTVPLKTGKSLLEAEMSPEFGVQGISQLRANNKQKESGLPALSAVPNGDIPPNFKSGEEKLIKPISGLDFVSDDARAFAEMIQREIVTRKLGARWEDVVGLEDAKTILQESLVYNHEFQEFFGTALPPWRGLLLYGPPGTGKTLLAKAVATECGTTFFNISSATIVSKWRGDSEKIVKVLFELARYHAPSTIFFDEFDALGSKRDAGESDAARRLKSEILQQMDGIQMECFSSSASTSRPVFILAATNLPWDLDPAILRRLEKRIYVPLPNMEERRALFHLHFSQTAEKVSETGRQGRNCNSLMYQMNLDDLAMATEGYSGSDIEQIVKETVVRKFRSNFRNKIKKLVIVTDDVMTAIKSIPSTVKPKLVERYNTWVS